MAVTTKFFFFCSVRLGSIIISVLTLIQACAFLGVTLNTSLQEISETLNEWMNQVRLEGSFYKDVVDNPKWVVTTISTIFSCLICSSILAVYGSFQCKSLLVYPFLLFYFLYILCLFVVFVLLVLFIKVRGNDLGKLILYSNLGGFILLFYLYTWCCVFSFVQIINELHNRLKKKLRAVETMKKKKTKGFYNYYAH